MSDEMTLLEKTKSEFQTRLEELRPAVDEFRQLEEALAAMTNDSQPRKTTRRKGHGTTATANRAKRGQRPQEMLALVRQQPGIKVSQAAEQMGVEATYLYRIVNKLASGDQPQIKKNEDGGYIPA